jgi:hypothetical protein
MDCRTPIRSVCQSLAMLGAPNLPHWPVLPVPLGWPAELRSPKWEHGGQWLLPSPYHFCSAALRWSLLFFPPGLVCIHPKGAPSVCRLLEAWLRWGLFAKSLATKNNRWKMSSTKLHSNWAANMGDATAALCLLSWLLRRIGSAGIAAVQALHGRIDTMPRRLQAVNCHKPITHALLGAAA